MRHRYSYGKNALQNDYALSSICLCKPAHIKYKNLILYVLFRRKRTYFCSLANIINRYSEVEKSKGSDEISGMVKSNQCIPCECLMKMTYSNDEAKIRNV
uniref:Uncharacterized protein n=1 Tax=Vespula pensylvanica TaxID=30213 RepID=A0A834PF91_VESPE|nr:hypothetical protein H0235_001035 [Vespula pensylvanica]